MKIIFVVCLFTILTSCFSKNGETEDLNQRITRLEQRIDSLTGKGQNTYSGDSFQNTRICLATTKKGIQCRRKAKANGYCWQHR